MPKREVRGTRGADVSRRSEIQLQGLLLPRWGFDWNELAPAARAAGLEDLPAGAVMTATDGRYVADHLSATRHIAATLWRSARNGGPIERIPRRYEHAAFAATLYLGLAEAAAQDACFWRITPELSRDAAASRFYEERLAAVRDAERHLGRALGALDELAQLADTAPAARGDKGGGVLADDASKPKADTQSEKGGDAVTDAIKQAESVMDSIKDLVKKFEKPEKEGDITELIKAVASAIVSGTKAALVSAVANLLKALDSDATPKDVDVTRGANGEVTIYFRVRKGCLLIFDWAVDDDFVFIKKGAKDGSWTFKTGDSAKQAHAAPGK